MSLASGLLFGAMAGYGASLTSKNPNDFFVIFGKYRMKQYLIIKAMKCLYSIFIFIHFSLCLVSFASCCVFSITLFWLFVF